MRRALHWTAILLTCTLCCGGTAAPLQAEEDAAKPQLNTQLLSALEMRSIGPALMSGRIADLAIDPVKPNTWYVAVGSGNLWKTENAGTTWTPIFDRLFVLLDWLRDHRPNDRQHDLGWHGRERQWPTCWVMATAST